MERVGGKAEESWWEDTIYCEATCAPDDVLYQGSEDEDYDSPVTRKLRYEAAGQMFLDGKIPLLLTATLKGPFDKASGWVNPWRSKHRTAETLRTMLPQRLPADKRKQNVSIPETQFEQHDSLECHLPSPESIKHAPVEEPHPFLEDDELAMVQQWRNSVHPLAKDEFWASASTGSRSERKRKATGSEWLRKLASKRQRTYVTESEPANTPVPKTSKSRGIDLLAFNSSFRSAPDQLPSSASASRIRWGESVVYQPSNDVDEDELAISHGSSFASAPSRLQSPGKRLSPKKDLKKRLKKRAIYDMAKDSDDELSRDEIVAMKAAATLSSPISQKRGSQTLTRKSPRHTLSQQTVEKRSSQLSSPLRARGSGPEVEEANFQTQQDESFLFRMRPKISKDGQRSESECDFAETESWSGLSSNIAESIAADTSDAGAAESANHSSAKADDPTTRKAGSVSSSDLSDLSDTNIDDLVVPNAVMEDGTASELSSLKSDDVDVPEVAAQDGIDVEMTVDSDASTASLSTSEESDVADEISEGDVTETRDAIEVVMEQDDATKSTTDAIATEPAMKRDCIEVATDIAEAVSDEAVPDAGTIKDEVDISQDTNNDAALDPETESLSEDEHISSQAEQSITPDEPTLVNESAPDPENNEHKADINSPSKPVAQDEPSSDPESESESEAKREETSPASHNASVSTPREPSLSEPLPLCLLKSSVKRLVPKSSWTTLSNLSRQTQSSPVRRTPRQRSNLNSPSIPEKPATQQTPELIRQTQDTFNASPFQSSPLAKRHTSPEPSPEQTPETTGIEPSRQVSVSRQSPWAGPSLSQHASLVSKLPTVPDTPRKLDESPLPSEAQTPWATESRLSIVSQSSTHTPTDDTVQTQERTPLGQLQNNAISTPSFTPTAIARPKTPEPQFSFKSFASFMSPSPERRPTNKQAAWRGSGSRLPSTRSILASATKNPWNGEATQRRVSWAPLPHEVSSPASSDMHTPMEPRRRTVSPPPATPIAELPTSQDAKFHDHFTAVARRSGNKHLRRILPTASQRSLASPAPQAMAETFLAADELRQPSPSHETPERQDYRTMLLPESQEPIDIVEDVMREMGGLLDTWDVDAELDLARKEGGMQSRPLTQSPW